MEHEPTGWQKCQMERGGVCPLITASISTFDTQRGKYRTGRGAATGNCRTVHSSHPRGRQAPIDGRRWTGGVGHHRRVHDGEARQRVGARSMAGRVCYPPSSTRGPTGNHTVSGQASARISNTLPYSQNGRAGGGQRRFQTRGTTSGSSSEWGCETKARQQDATVCVSVIPVRRYLPLEVRRPTGPSDDTYGSSTGLGVCTVVTRTTRAAPQGASSDNVAADQPSGGLNDSTLWEVSDPAAGIPKEEGYGTQQGCVSR